MRKKKHRLKNLDIKFPRTVYKCPVCGHLNVKKDGVFNSDKNKIRIKCSYCETVVAYDCETGRPVRWSI